MTAARTRSQSGEGPVTWAIDGPLDRSTVSRWHRELTAQSFASGGELRLDLAGVTSMDSAGAAFCNVLRTRAERAGGRLTLSGLSEAARDALSMFRVRIEPVASSRRQPGWFERIGERAAEGWEGLFLFAVLVTDTLHYTVTGLFGRRNRVRFSAVVEQMIRIGLESFGIVALISLLVGLVVSLQSAVQLEKFGANLFLADLVGVSMTREMGPLMTAIILAGRSGSSIAAEIATMTITEEIDALRTMGVEPVRYLVVPRFLAITITKPLLVAMADLVGILGGFFIAVTFLGLGAQAFIDRLLQALVLKDLLAGLIKSVAFAWIIVFVGAHRGFRVTGGATGVGLATTRSVVQSIFFVIVADAFFSLLFYFPW